MCPATSRDVANGGGVQGPDADKDTDIVGVSREYTGGRGGDGDLWNAYMEEDAWWKCPLW